MQRKGKHFFVCLEKSQDGRCSQYRALFHIQQVFDTSQLWDRDKSWLTSWTANSFKFLCYVSKIIGIHASEMIEIKKKKSLRSHKILWDSKSNVDEMPLNDLLANRVLVFICNKGWNKGTGGIPGVSCLKRYPDILRKHFWTRGTISLKRSEQGNKRLVWCRKAVLPTKADAKNRSKQNVSVLLCVYVCVCVCVCV